MILLFAVGEVVRRSLWGYRWEVKAQCKSVRSGYRRVWATTLKRKRPLSPRSPNFDLLTSVSPGNRCSSRIKPGCLYSRAAGNGLCFCTFCFTARTKIRKLYNAIQNQKKSKIASKYIQSTDHEKKVLTFLRILQKKSRISFHPSVKVLLCFLINV